MKILLKILLVIVIIGALAVGGVFFALNTGKQVDTAWSEENFQAGLEKSQISIGSIEEINLETLVRNTFSTEGTNYIDESFTGQEISALISKANDPAGPIRNVRLAFGNNGEAEASFDLSERFTDFLVESGIIGRYTSGNYYASAAYLSAAASDNSLTDYVISYISRVANNKPVHATGKLARASSNSISIQIDSLTVGRVPMGRDVIEKVEFETIRIVNSIISESNGFHIEELRVENGELYYKGTLPAEIEGRRL